MSVGVATTTTGPDPVRVALADTAVGERLVAAARTFLAARSGGALARDAAEIVQEASTRALARAATFDPSRDVVAWLVGFVINVAREHVRDRAARTAAPQLADLAADLGRPVADAAADRELVARLLAQLSAADRELVRLVYTDDLPFAEVGPLLGTTETAARVRHHRLLKQLRELAGAGEVRP